MKITVDLDVCDSHGQCVFAAPHLFDFDDIGELVFDATPPESERAAVELAARLCPVRAITVDP